MKFAEQFSNAKLSVFNNRWSVIHDFTPSNRGTNYGYLSANIRIYDLLEQFSNIAPDFISKEEEMMNHSQHLVPFTVGKCDAFIHANASIVFLPGHSADARLFLQSLYSTQYAEKLSVHDCKEWKFTKSEIATLFGKSDNSQSVKFAKQEALKGPIIVLAIVEKTEGELGSILFQCISACTTAKSCYVSNNIQEANHMNNYIFVEHRVET